MARHYGKKRRKSTIESDNRIHEALDDVKGELGGIYFYISRSEIYRRVADKVHIGVKTVANVLNHTEYTRL